MFMNVVQASAKKGGRTLWMSAALSCSMIASCCRNFSALTFARGFSPEKVSASSTYLQQTGAYYSARDNGDRSAVVRTLLWDKQKTMVTPHTYIRSEKRAAAGSQRSNLESHMTTCYESIYRAEQQIDRSKRWEAGMTHGNPLTNSRRAISPTASQPDTLSSWSAGQCCVSSNSPPEVTL